MEGKLEKLRGGVTLVRPEDRKAVEDMCREKISQWKKRKRMFKDLWDAITENSPKDLKEFKVVEQSTPYLQTNLAEDKSITAVVSHTGGAWHRAR